jgi:hypothetical protein
MAYATSCFVLSVHHTGSAEDDVIYPPTAASNGKRVYLSAAYHTADAGARGECSVGGQVRTERFMARSLGQEIADELDGFGYRIRLGRGDPNENTSRSNTWGSNAHIPLHSNAAAGPCSGADGSIRGTWMIVRQGDPTGLANDIRAYVQGSSPGTNDRLCSITTCTTFSCLVELCSTTANKKAYSETEFHDWNQGVAYLVNDRDLIGFAFRAGIDANFGYPRG